MKGLKNCILLPLYGMWYYKTQGVGQAPLTFMAAVSLLKLEGFILCSLFISLLFIYNFILFLPMESRKIKIELKKIWKKSLIIWTDNVNYIIVNSVLILGNNIDNFSQISVLRLVTFAFYKLLLSVLTSIYSVS